MNLYEKRMLVEENERLKKVKEAAEWEKNDLTVQQGMKQKEKYKITLDGTPYLYSSSNQDLEVGDVIVIADEHQEMTVQKITSLVYKKDYKYLEAKWLKVTEPTNEESKNSYLIEEVEYYFENKLSKNQMILAAGELYTVEGIEKGTKNLHLNKVDTKKTKRLYAVYNNQGLNNKTGERFPEYFYEQWGDAFGVVLKNRFTGKQYYSL
jgi:hypothetical protein